MYTITPSAYVFTHAYLNTMQQGIQAAHTVSELYTQNFETVMFEDVMDWGMSHKTLKILNGGTGDAYLTAMHTLEELAIKHTIPFAVFREPDNNNSPTFGVVISPEMAERLQSHLVEVTAYNAAIEYKTDPLNTHALPMALDPLASFLIGYPSAR